MYLILLGFVLFVMAGIVNGGMDILTYNSNTFIFKSDWWLSNGKYSWDKRTWLKKYLLSFISNGWHFLKFIYIMLMLLSISIMCFSGCLYTTLFGFIIKIILLYIIEGSAFEVGYTYIFKKKS
jgi:hypothetical protein